MKNLENFWNSCDENFAHLTLSRHLFGFDALTSFWEDAFVSKINFKDKSVIDYGMGGGHLGKYLLSKKDLKHYTGIDISTRSIDFAKNNLVNFKNQTTLIHTDEFYNKFNAKADIFISQACIQHFHDEKYLLSFLKKIESLSCSTVMLQIRYNNKTIFNPTNSYVEEKDVCFACQTNDAYLSKNLKSYKLKHKSKIYEPSKYLFLVYEKA